MKKLIFAILAVIFLSCTNQTDTVQVSFTGDKFGIESGQLKSFDINKWEHFHYPDKVVVTLVNTNNKTVFTTDANSGKVFFENGTNVIHVPVGTYICSVEGGGKILVHYGCNGVYKSGFQTSPLSMVRATEKAISLNQ